MNARHITRPIRLVVMIALLTMSLATVSEAGAINPITVADGDVAGLIAAIEAANDTGQVIELASNGTYQLTQVHSIASGPNGLPQVTGKVVIKGNGSTIQRVEENESATQTPGFRIFAIDAGGTLDARNTIVSGGVSDVGGGIMNFYGTLNLTNSVVSGNHANHDGGGIVNFGTVTLTDSTVAHNSATWGGGIYSYDILTLTSSTVRDNSADDNGGGIYNHHGTLTLHNSTVTRNTANNSGGGIRNFYASLTLTNTMLSENSAPISGGGIFSTEGAMTITSSTFRGNSARVAGGIHNGGGVLTVTNSTFSGNSAVFAGAVYALNGTSELTNSTVTGNHARNEGGGIRNFPGGTLTLSNTLVAGNTSATGPDVWGQITDNGYNLLGDASGSTGLTNGINGNLVGSTTQPIDPRLGTLQDNGGPTQTHALLANSPAIDAVSLDVSFLPTDQRGVPRPQGAGADIGAFEVEVASPSPETKRDCMQGGWESFGFRNQGQCIRYINTGFDSR